MAIVPFPRDRGGVAASANPLIKYFMPPAEQRGTGHTCVWAEHRNPPFFPLKEEE